MDARFDRNREHPTMRKRLRYADLVALGVINNRATLGNWIRTRAFPPGQMTGPNTRTWDEGEVEAWIMSQPAAPRAMPQVEGKRGRPRGARTGRWTVT
jgi:predicted DNA-binding transcriptional regulator AlpA